MYDNTRIHYSLVNTNHHIRFLLLDRHGYASFNHTSILSTVESSNNEIARVSETSDGDKFGVKVFNKTGLFSIESQSVSYRNKKASVKVSNSLNIQVVHNVEIEPKYKSLYFLGAENPMKFELVGGSGHFAVSLNDSKIADIQHVGRNVTIIPKKEGSIKIFAEDVELPGSIIASSELLISDVRSIYLDSAGYLIEQRASLNMTVTAFDRFGVEFDLD